MGSEIKDFTDLIIWQKAIVLGKQVYGIAARFPSEEKFGLTTQLRRAIVSVASNIAEGHPRTGKGFVYFLDIARGSLAEVESQLLFAVELEYVSRSEVTKFRQGASEIHRMAVTLITKLRPGSLLPCRLAALSLVPIC